MCDCLEGEETAMDPGCAIPLAVLMERTRAAEVRIAGERVPERLWPVFFGLSSGSIPWPHHQRMVASRQTALAFLAASAPSRRRLVRSPALRCTDVPDGSPPAP
jgi:hypothetical protein